MTEIKERTIKMDDFIHVEYKDIKRLHELGVKNGNEIMLFCKILTLQKSEMGCITGNDYFSKLFCISDRQIRDYLHDLKKKGLIKTYEKKLGLKTTTRHIYVQYDVLRPEEEILHSSVKAEEENFRSSEEEILHSLGSINEPPEEIRQTTGRNGSEEWKKYVEGTEDIFHHIIDNNRIEYNILESTPPKDNNSFITPDGVATKEKRSFSDISDQECQEMFDKYNSGQTMEELMEEYNAPRDVVSEALRYILLP